MLNLNDFATRGQVIDQRDGVIVFKPAGANYEWHLKPAAPFDALMNEPISVLLRASARKTYTVPSGGNFVQPICGTPKIIQGRVKFVNERQAVVHAGANFVIELPASDSAMDLNNGKVAVGSMINVVVLLGATIELIAQTVSR